MEIWRKRRRRGDHIPGAVHVGLIQLRLALVKADLRPRVDHQGHVFPEGLKRLRAQPQVGLRKIAGQRKQLPADGLIQALIVLPRGPEPLGRLRMIRRPNQDIDRSLLLLCQPQSQLRAQEPGAAGQ